MYQTYHTSKKWEGYPEPRLIEITRMNKQGKQTVIISYGAVPHQDQQQDGTRGDGSVADTISISSESYYISDSSDDDTSFDENAPLNNRFPSNDLATQKEEASVNPSQIIAVLLLGIFVANADGSIVLATNGIISSEFGRLDDASWLITGYMLSMCAMQPLYGKLSDIYGRISILLTSYAFFGVGCLYSGIGRTLPEIIIGRVISGIGGAGMMALVSILITDLIPQREVAAWRAYVNIAATTGRSLGGPIGGYLIDTVGWRWSFIGQAPLIGVAGLLVWSRLRKVSKITNITSDSTKSKLARIDFLGATFLSSAIVSILLVLDLGGQRLPWGSYQIIALSILSTILFFAFAYVEAYVANEPIFPLHLLKKNNIATSYLSLGLQSVSQIGIMYSVPRYFQITTDMSATESGAHLIPAVVGNVTGGLITGISVKRTGRYKLAVVLAGLIATISSTLLILRWNGRTNFWESLYIFPGGFGMGLAQAASFVAMTAGLEKEHYAVATSGLYLSSNIGAMGGVSIVNVVLENAVRSMLNSRLKVDGSREIIEKAIRNIAFIKTLTGEVRDIVISSYVDSLKFCYGVTLLCSTLAFLAGLFIREKKLEG